MVRVRARTLAAWLWLATVGGAPGTPRVDRLLAEVQAAGGDRLIRTLLFGISDPTAIRSCLERSLLH
jgi:hypothetical protein